MNYVVIMIQEIVSQNFMSKQNAGEEMQINFAFQPQVVQHPEEKMHIILF